MEKNTEQLQIRIDSKTKRDAKKVLDGLGMDMSSAVKIFFKQIIITGNFPCEIRDSNGLTLSKAELLRESMIEANGSSKKFKRGGELLADALKD
jgi:addiction module RelB/DinJ family antitoxin